MRMSRTWKQSFGNHMNANLRCSEHPNPPRWEWHHAEITRAGSSVPLVFRIRAAGGIKEAEGQRGRAPHTTHPHLPRVSPHPPGTTFPPGPEKQFMR